MEIYHFPGASSTMAYFPGLAADMTPPKNAKRME